MPVVRQAGGALMVGRQGIYDAARNRIGYELLFRDLGCGADRRVSGVEMTAEVVYSALSLGLDEVADQRLIFCNADRDVLVGDLLYTLPTAGTVVEILETVELDDEVLGACTSLTAAGYSLAADDFRWRPGAEQLLDLCAIVKLDVLHTGRDEITDLIARCRRYDVELLAEKVEDLAELDDLIAAGFTLFQGYALERPQVMVGSSIGPSDLGRLRTAVELLGPDLDLERIEEVLRGDPGLSVQIIRLASTGPLRGFGRRVGSLHEALVLAGTRQVQNWVALLLARPGAAVDRDGLTATLIRARACELLAGGVAPDLACLGFAAGMLSAVDLLFHVEPGAVRDALPLTAELEAAAFDAEGPVGRIVSDAIDYQLGKADAVRRSRVSDEQLRSAFAEAYGWATASLG